MRLSFPHLSFNPPKGFQHLDVKFLTFPGGEPHCNVPPVFSRELFIEARIRNFQEFGLFLMFLNALDTQNSYRKEIVIYIPYFPGSRQDRNPNGETPLTPQVYASCIKAAMPNNHQKILLYTFDIHSDAALQIITKAIDPLFQCVYNIDVDELDGFYFDEKYEGIIAPDAGALMRATKFRDKHYPDAEVIECEKKRDFATGHITHYDIKGTLGPGPYLVVDDICDGGMTFNLLAESAGTELDLYVSHGIFSKGISNLSSYFRKIYTTNSLSLISEPYPADDETPSRLIIIPVPEP